MTDQLTLFDDALHDDHTMPCHWCGGLVPPPHFPGVPGVAAECRSCRGRAVAAQLVAYAKYGRPGRRKYPGMLFPGQQQGDGEPTAAQRERLLELLRTSGLSNQ